MLVSTDLKVLGQILAPELTKSRAKFCLMLPAAGSECVSIGKTLQTYCASLFVIVLEDITESQTVVFIWEITVVTALMSTAENCLAMPSQWQVK